MPIPAEVGTSVTKLITHALRGTRAVDDTIATLARFADDGSTRNRHYVAKLGRQLEEAAARFGIAADTQATHLSAGRGGVVTE